MKEYKKEFIEFLLANNSLKFGEFTLKSGRVSPYFINTGMFNDAKSVSTLATYYAQTIKDNFGEDFDVLYGPAYKGIPLCVSTLMKLNEIGISKSYAFDRKEVKNYGDGKCIVGADLHEDTKIVIIDDVITAGTAIRLNLEKLKQNGNPKIVGVVISVDRKEKGQKDKSAIQEVEESLSVRVASIINLDDIIEYLKDKGKDVSSMLKYREEYGV